MTGFYIHIRDIGFADAPWPGERRLGPYESRKIADGQAEVAKEQGFDVIGIFTEAHSELSKETGVAAA